MKMTAKKTTETPQTELEEARGDTQKALHGAKIALKNAVYERATETLEIGGRDDGGNGKRC